VELKEKGKIENEFVHYGTRQLDFKRRGTAGQQKTLVEKKNLWRLRTKMKEKKAG